MGKIMFFLIFLIVFGIAVKTKKKLRHARNLTRWEDAVESPASLAIGELVAVAGGIYLALTLLATFLKISMPERLVFFDWSVDYLAAIAIVLAILQPIVLALYYKICNKF
ncbi:MAG: hypothetical protein GX092_06470 [Clostridia bacterium]|jgi:hypothetical protein|nr:hypothetical protein [Clostridia bacterium]